MLRSITFDGGGIRGLISIVLLDRLISHRPELLREASLLAGTSTGGLIALALADDFSIDHLRSLYQFRGKRIFVRNWLTPFGLFGARYHSRGLFTEIDLMFDDRTLGELPRKVLIPAFGISSVNDRVSPWGAKFFTNWDGNDPDCRLPIRDVAMATAAAPTYFRTWRGFADGGMAANNPCAAAMALLLNPKLTAEEAGPKDVKILSIGTGTCPRRLKGKNLNWGLAQWGGKLVDVFMDGLEAVPTYQCASVLRNNFCRVQPVVKDSQLPALDDYKKTAEMVAIAEAYDLGPAFDWLDKQW